MKMHSGASVGAVLCALAIVGVAASSAAQDAGSFTSTAPSGTLFRVFLTDGSSLVSYGEVARVADRVVFSMPTSAAIAGDLQLVDLPADRVDWDRTTKYAESARASQYLATQAVIDYARLSSDVTNVLNEVTRTADPARRLAIAEQARRTLAGWPAAHYGYKQDEVRQMIGLLDEAIADLRAALGSGRFDLTLVSMPDAAPASSAEPIMPAPTTQDAIGGLVAAARAVDSPDQRESLLAAALSGIEKSPDALPAEWAATTASRRKADIAREQATDQSYRRLTDTMLGLAKVRAKAADVRGLEQLLSQIHQRDAALGASRPDAVKALVESIQIRLDAARRLQLARDQWALRSPAYREYRASIARSLLLFAEVRARLEDIKSLAGSSPFALDAIQRAVAEIRIGLSKVLPPDELRDAHSLFVSAAELADNAAKIRREAALTGAMTRAWDASAAASGSLMLTERARSELQSKLKMPELVQ